MWNRKCNKKEISGKGKVENNLFRLPKNVIAQHYTVCFKPHVNDLSFEASVAINLKLLENSKQITMNAAELIVTKVMWEEDVTFNRQEPMEMQLQDKGQLVVNFDPFLVPQEGQLRMNFRGKISDKKMVGFYRSKCKLNEDEYNLITRFVPCDARRALPCWDDPACKAPFDVCLVVEKGKTVLSNMIVKVVYPHKRNPDMEIVEFKQTPPMSASSLAIVIGSYDYVGRQSDDEEVAVRVYTSPGKQEEGKYALDVACKAIPFLTHYLECPFPLQKLDHIAIADFPINGLDNWGLAMYPEANLLLDQGKGGSVGDKLAIALNVSEQTVKQWVGNLVTIDWWSQVWVKDGLANFIKYFCLDEVRPEFELATHFVNDIVQKALRMDGMKSTRSLELPVHSALEAEEIFDDFGYKKGACILRMLHSYIGDDKFRLGLNIFLTRYKFKSATCDELWKCFEEASSKPISAVMSTWIYQKGFPLIKVTAKQDGKNRFLKLTQDKFSLDPLARDARNESIWMIPLTVTSGEDPSSVVFHTLMDTKTTTIVIPNIAKTEWVKLNSSVVGYYRVRYPPDMLPTLLHAIRDKSLEPLDRLNILDDQFALLMAGLGATVEVLTLMEAFMEEDDFNVWYTISSIFDKLIKVFGHVSLDDSVRHFGRYLYTRIFERTGFAFHLNDTYQQIMLRGLILRMMTKFNHPITLNKCKAIYEGFIRGEETIPADLRYIVYSAVLIKGDEETVKAMIRMYKESDCAEEKHRISNALGSVRDLQMIKYVLEFAISDDVRKQDSIGIIVSASKTKGGRELSWNFFKENFVFFKTRYGPALQSKLIRAIIEDFGTEEKAVELTDYFKANQLPGTDRAVQQGIESIRVNDAWLKHEKNLSALQDYMEADAL